MSTLPRSSLGTLNVSSRSESGTPGSTVMACMVFIAQNGTQKPHPRRLWYVFQRGTGPDRASARHRGDGGVGGGENHRRPCAVARAGLDLLRGRRLSLGVEH